MRLLHFEIFIFSSMLFIIGSLLWFVTMLPSVHKDSAHTMLLISSLTFIIGSCGFFIMPFISLINK